MHDEHPPPDATPSYAEAVRRHPGVVLGVVALAMLVGLLWLVARSHQYEASAQILVSPVSADDHALVGLQVVRDSAGDPTRTIQTAASLLDSPASATAAASILGGSWTERTAQAAVRVETLGQTSLVAVTAQASSPQGAVEVADAYATGALLVRDRIVGAEVRRRLSDLNAQLAGVPPASQAAIDLTQRRDELVSVRGGDPSLSLAQRAALPTGSSGKPGWLIFAVILAIGLAVAAATAAALEALERQRPEPRSPRGRSSRRAATLTAPRRASAASRAAQHGRGSAASRPTPRNADLDAEPGPARPQPARDAAAMARHQDDPASPERNTSVPARADETRAAAAEEDRAASDNGAAGAETDAGLVLKQLRAADRPITFAELCAALGEPRGPRVRDRLRQLAEQGEVVRAGSGRRGDPYVYRASGPRRDA